MNFTEANEYGYYAIPAINWLLNLFFSKELQSINCLVNFSFPSLHNCFSRIPSFNLHISLCLSSFQTSMSGDSHRWVIKLFFLQIQVLYKTTSSFTIAFFILNSLKKFIMQLSCSIKFAFIYHRQFM